MVSSEKVETTKKRRHLSKKNKISWRKNVDIQDVEDFLEDQRLEERLGTPFAQKDDSELFVIDTLPSSKSAKASSKAALARGALAKRAPGLTARQSKRIALQEPPKCFQPLVNTSKVGDPSGKRNHVRPVLVGKQTELKRQRSGAYRKKWEAAQKNRAQHRQQKKELQECRTNITQDLWGEQEVTRTAPVPEPEWLSRDTRDCNTLQIRPPRPPRHAAKSKPVIAPHPGASYNPNFKDHQELLQDVISQELKVMKEEEHLNRVTSAMFRRVSPREKAEEDLKELRQGLDENGPDSEGDGQDYRAVNPPAQRRKKDLRKKRHMREEKLAQVTRLVEAKEKKKHSDVYKLRFLQKAVVTREVQQKTEKAQRVKKRLEAPPQPRINSVGYREPPPDFLEAQELSGNLRNLTPKGGGLLDHWTSLQRRGLAPVSSPHVLKAAKKKRYTLTSHKLPEEIKEGPAKPSKRK